MDLMKDKDYLVILNEPKFPEDVLTEEEVKCYSSTHSKNLAIITNMENWKLMWMTEDYDVLMVESNGLADKYVICGLYINPSMPLSRCKLLLKEVHDRLRSRRSNRLILGGDLNAQSTLWSPKEDNRGKAFRESFIHCKLYSPIPCDSSTGRVNFSGEWNWIDVLLVDNTMRKEIRKSGGEILSNSDHNLVFIEVGCKQLKKVVISKTKMVRIVENTKLDFLSSKWTNCSNADRKCIILEQLMVLTGTKSTLQVYKKRSAKIIPEAEWRLQRRLKSSISKCRKKIYNASSKVSEDELGTKESKLATLNSRIKKLKRAYKRKRVNKLIKEGKMWYMIKKSLGTGIFDKTVNFDPSHQGKERVTNEEEYCTKFGCNVPAYENQIRVFEETKIELDRGKLLKIVRYKIAKKSCMYELHISGRTLSLFLTHHGEIIVDFVLECLNRGYTPQYVKRSRIALIPKACGKRVRPVTVMHVLYRLFDIVLFEVIKSKVKVWWNKQFAFKPKTGPNDLFRHLKFLLEKMDNQCPAILISVDLRDAFENLNFESIFLSLVLAGVSPKWSMVVLQHIKGRLSMIRREGRQRWFRHNKGTP